MLNSEFSHWLFGYCRLADKKELTSKQLWVIKNHLNLVFAVEGFLSPRNKWLDESIITLVDESNINSINPTLVKEIFNRYDDIE